MKAMWVSGGGVQCLCEPGEPAAVGQNKSHCAVQTVGTFEGCQLRALIFSDHCGQDQAREVRFEAFFTDLISSGAGYGRRECRRVHTVFDPLRKHSH